MTDTNDKLLDELRALRAEVDAMRRELQETREAVNAAIAAVTGGGGGGALRGLLGRLTGGR